MKVDRESRLSLRAVACGDIIRFDFAQLWEEVKTSIVLVRVGRDRAYTQQSCLHKLDAPMALIIISLPAGPSLGSTHSVTGSRECIRNDRPGTLLLFFVRKD
jgi:hypothetical protein